MKTYKHYSFDLWLTLIKSNPVFKKERALFFYQHLNAAKKSLEEVETTFRRVDLMTNAINQKTGGNLETEEIYLMVIFELNGSNSTFENIDIKWLLHEMEQLFFQYIPTIYNAETLSTLNILKENPDISMSILSNTAFVKGSTLRVMLKHLALDQFFSFQHYSDEVGMSKPNPQFFGLMVDNVQAIRQNDNINLQEIIHIGDNFVADILGANSSRINSFLINSNNNTIAGLLK